MKKTIKGNLITMSLLGDFDVIIHGQNCFHSWGAGIVKEIARSYPAAKVADLNTKKGDKKKLGTYSSAKITLNNGKELIVVNAYTQYSYGVKKCHLNDRALQEVFQKISVDFEGKKIAYPKIGAGRAGGDWKKISVVIDKEFENIDHTLVVI